MSYYHQQKQWIVKNSAVFFSKQSFQEPEATTTPSDTVKAEKAVSGQTRKWEPEAYGCGYQDPTWERDTRLLFKLSKTPNISSQGRQRNKKHFLLSTKHLCKYAANAPEVHRGGIAGLQEDFRCSVPQRDDLQGQAQRSVTGGDGHLLHASCWAVSCRDSAWKGLLKSYRGHWDWSNK